MQNFAHVLRSFRDGALTQDQVLSELLRMLAIERAAPAELLDILEAHQRQHPLPPDAHASIVARIAGWLLDPTVATNLNTSSKVSSTHHDAPATVILEKTATQSTVKTAGAARGKRLPQAGVGSVLQGRFRLIELIGEGGMSRVFKAIDLRKVEAGAPDPHVAVKVLTAPLSDYFGSIASLQREAHKLQNLTHPNIVRVIDCDRDGQTVFMTMEYLPGEPLNKLLRARKPAGLERATGESIILAIAGALDHAHRNQIVHGDLKPGNVIVTSAGSVKVIDFGMALFIATPIEGSSTKSGSPTDSRPPGLTPRYASPEMLAGLEPGPADDVYSLACVAYEILTGAHPLEGNEETQRDPHKQLMQPPGMSARRFKAIKNALAFDRNGRTPDVTTFITEFQDKPDQPRKPRFSWKWVAAVLVLIGLAYYWGNSPSRSPPVAPRQILSLKPGTVIRDCPTCPLLVALPTGSFEQGSSDANALPFEKPRHAVTIAYPLVMSVNEITVGEFEEFATSTGRPMKGCNTYDGQWQLNPDADWRHPGYEQSALHPVVCTSWEDATAFAAWLSTKSGHAYRLPSASEWEYAAAAGSVADRPWGADEKAVCVNANVADRQAEQRYPGWAAFDCNDGFVATAPVGSFRTNTFGLNDMLGNAFEWVQDCWRDDYVGAPHDGTASIDGDCNEHELRGGSWFSAPAYLRTTYRNRFEARYRSSSVGFRLVREIRQ